MKRTLFLGLCAAAALAFLPLGCTAPQVVRWSDEAGAIGPERPSGGGYLSVVRNDPLFLRARVPRFKSVPFRLYSDQGRFLATYHEPYLPPVSLPPGRYVVIARVNQEERRVQVLVREGRLTRVDLDRLETDPATPEIPAN